MHSTVDLTIEPNDKYERVIGLPIPADGETEDATAHSDPYEEWPDEHQEAANGYADLIANAPTPDDYDTIDEDDLDVLTWDDISPASDPDLLAKIATYFDGMSPDEPTERLRAKCRLLDVEVYADVQIAAREELRGD